MKYNGKDVYFLTYRPHIDDFAVLSNTWTKRVRNNELSVILLTDIKSVTDKIKNSKGTLKQDDTLYFGKTSEFPRFKLSESNFRRCIKLEKADCVIIGKVIGTEHHNWTLLEDELYAYVVESTSYSLNYVYCNDSSKKTEWTTDWFAYIKKYNLFFGTEIKKVHTGALTVFSGDSAIDAQNIMNGTYKNLILDEELDKVVNVKLDVLTKEDVDSICEMLDSPDTGTKAVGLKMLCGYNVNETPLTVRTILGAREQLGNLSEWKSVGVQQVLSSINWGGFSRFPYNMTNALRPGYKTYTYTDLDKDLCKNVYLSLIKRHMDSAINELINGGVLTTFDLNVTYKIE